jgi:hypothetical protein
LGSVNHHEAAAAQTRGRLIDHGKRERRCDRRVDSIAAALKNLHARGAREFAVGDNEARARFEHAVAGTSAKRQNDEEKNDE